MLDNTQPFVLFTYLLFIYLFTFFPLHDKWLFVYFAHKERKKS